MMITHLLFLGPLRRPTWPVGSWSLGGGGGGSTPEARRPVSGRLYEASSLLGSPAAAAASAISACSATTSSFREQKSSAWKHCNNRSIKHSQTCSARKMSKSLTFHLFSTSGFIQILASDINIILVNNITVEQSTLNHQSQMKYCWLNKVPLGQRRLSNNNIE